ncbi:XrtA/PEP-CTERM system amidotransferase [Aestuariispira insulae]|uniref:asparagine synthase (glutamine-hydrolyzing) n=1 Tax=Aestuariispira insulae TaxID=1461337 RepID=A0A3D9HKB0_9PROT|nr:XrtA/PEP-CTERM system amidotransferase [Aestuariispira insulae]RED49855.1 asparagine synthase (glutamine-hydrolysing) [Aestuariispira insulae]
MCGLVGIFDSREKRPVDPAVLTAMNDSIIHRGPDGDGIHVVPGLGLGHRRLSIIDLEGGIQPMFDETGEIAIVFNGEIYNFQDLRRELQGLGYHFRTNSDTEVIVHGWKAWGADCVKRLRGMFAIALYDAREEILFLSRDRFGKKPLYYCETPDGHLVFGSELKTLMAYPGLALEIDPQAVEDYIALGYVPDPKSIYKSIRKLPQAHNLIQKRGGSVRLERYWQLDMTPRVTGSVEALGEELIERLQEATRIRMISDVPLGAFLSGGVDSSAVVAMMAGLSNQPVNSYSVAVKDKAYDESAYAQEVAERYQTHHATGEFDPSAIDLVDKVCEMYDEPFGDSSAMPTFRVCKHARSGVTVALSGDGGDELIAGYRRYGLHKNTEKVRQMIPSGLRRPLFGMLGCVYPKMDWAPQFLRAKTTFQELGMDASDAYFNAISNTGDEQRSKLFSKGFKQDLQGYSARDALRPSFAEVSHLDAISQAQYADMHTYLSGKILVKVDRASMANSLEVRSPLLDHELAEWISSLDPDIKLRNGIGKYLFKKALEPYLSQDILYRPKQGFSIPLGKWFRRDLKEQVAAAVTSERMMQSGYFSPDRLRKLVSQHQSGLRDHSDTLWLLFMFDGFLKRSERRAV